MRFDEAPNENTKISFKCKICKQKQKAPFNHITNLNKHLENSHPELKQWFERYRIF